MDYLTNLLKDVKTWAAGICVLAVVAGYIFSLKRGSILLRETVYRRYRYAFKPRRGGKRASFIGGTVRKGLRACGWIVAELLALRDLFWLQWVVLKSTPRHVITPREVQRMVEFALLRPASDEGGRLRRWKRQELAVVRDGAPYEFTTCFDLHESLTESKRMYRYAKWIKHSKALDFAAEGKVEEERFSRNPVCEIAVQDGFAAPLYLLAGLLAQFKEQWPSIVAAYGDNWEPRDALLTVRKIQLYQFFCWLIWGPSLPLCQSGKRSACTSWGTATDTSFPGLLQYGYGDESNSILVQCVDNVYGKIKSCANVRTELGTPLACRLSLRGSLRFKDLLSENERHEIPPSYFEAGAANVILRVTDQDAVTAGWQDVRAYQRRTYYGAYLWVMFAICQKDAKDPSKYVGIECKKAGSAWLSLLPYFVHGNIAEEHSYEHVSHLVADAATIGAFRILRDFKDLYLVYVAAVDHSNCGNPLLLSEDRFAGGDSLTTDDDNAAAPKQRPAPGRAARDSHQILEHLWRAKTAAGHALEHLILPPHAQYKDEGQEFAYRRPHVPIRDQSSGKVKLLEIDGCNLPSVVHSFLASLNMKPSTQRKRTKGVSPRGRSNEPPLSPVVQ